MTRVRNTATYLITGLCLTFATGHTSLDPSYADMTYTPNSTDTTTAPTAGIDCAETCSRNCTYECESGRTCSDGLDEMVFSSNTSIAIVNTTSSSVVISWSATEYAVDNNITYNITYSHVDSNKSSTLDTDTREVPIRELEYNTWYTITVVPCYKYCDVCGAGINGTAKTSCIAPNPPSVTWEFDDDTGQVNVSWQMPTDTGCDAITSVTIELVQGNGNLSFRYTVNETDLNRSSTVLSVEPGNYSVTVTVFNEELLHNDNSTLLYIPNITTPDPEDKGPESVDDSEKEMLIIVLTVVPGGCVVSLIICVAIMSTRNRKNDVRSAPTNGHVTASNGPESRVSRHSNATAITILGSSPKSGPVQGRLGNGTLIQGHHLTGAIPIKSFEHYFDSCQTNQLFKEKFKAIPLDGQGTTEEARKPTNVIKNRYKNIIPYDSNRVPLPLVDGEPDSDYINASFITGNDGRGGYYIAAQGPKPESVNDYWRMIVTYDVTRVVMLTSCRENVKVLCEEYWPAEVGSRCLFDTVVVKCDTMERTAHYMLRSLSVSCKGKMMYVRHYQMTSWKDKTKPDSPLPMLDMMQRIRAGGGQGGGPLLVHCSAGAGRTGTYIALDCLLDQVVSRSQIDVDDTVRRLRSERPWMVQTQNQYVFIHEFLVTYLKIGGAAVNISHLIDSLKLNPELEKFIVKQYNAICNVTNKLHTPDIDDVPGKSPENTAKNRLPHLVASERFRAFLNLPVDGATDYINAIYLNSFWTTNGVIVTQIPLPETVTDFWRLLHDHDVGLIILLEDSSSLEENIPRYWPTEDKPTHSYGPLQVQLTAQGVADGNPNIIVREFSMPKARRTGDIQKVQLYELRGWYPGRSAPCSHSDISYLIERIQHHTTSGTGRIVVQCLDGVSHCGLFCAASHVVAQSKLWTDIDCPLAVLSCREQRKEFVIDLEQYRYLYHLLQYSLRQREMIFGPPSHSNDPSPVYENVMSETVC